MPTVLYIASSSYSGSTLLAFLLNCHPDVFTVGEMNGWNYGPEDTFNCSCGLPLGECPLFRHIAEAFVEEGLQFDPRNFGTDYVLAKSHRMNRFLAGGLPGGLHDSRLEKLRDWIVWQVPGLSRQLRAQDRANATFIRAALAFSGAGVFVDACKSPYRLRHLRRIDDLDFRIVHLVRDPRGIVLSNKVKWGRDPAETLHLWVREQADIRRISREIGPVLTVYYDRLCVDADESLAEIHRFAGVDPSPFTGDFKTVEHHILGNVMRFQEGGRVVPDSRWHRELSASDQAVVEWRVREEVARSAGPGLEEIVDHFLDGPVTG